LSPASREPRRAGDNEDTDDEESACVSIIIRVIIIS
jgi:hypothetical protein